MGAEPPPSAAWSTWSPRPRSRSPRPRRIVDRFARWYTPAVILAAALVAVISRDVELALAFLVIGYPGALVVAAPVAVVAGLGSAAEEGILIKGGERLERIGRIDTVAFDKTGTLTQGRPPGDGGRALARRRSRRASRRGPGGRRAGLRRRGRAAVRAPPGGRHPRPGRRRPAYPPSRPGTGGWSRAVGRNRPHGPGRGPGRQPGPAGRPGRGARPGAGGGRGRPGGGGRDHRPGGRRRGAGRRHRHHRSHPAGRRRGWERSRSGPAFAGRVVRPGDNLAAARRVTAQLGHRPARCGPG